EEVPSCEGWFVPNREYSKLCRFLYGVQTHKAWNIPGSEQTILHRTARPPLKILLRSARKPCRLPALFLWPAPESYLWTPRIKQRYGAWTPQSEPPAGQT